MVKVSHLVLVPEGPDIDVQPSALGRSKTTINVPTNSRERIMATSPGAAATQSASSGDTDPPAAIAVSRSNTAPGGVTRGVSMRALSIRKAGNEGGAPPAPPKPSTQNCLAQLLPNISLLTVLQRHLRAALV